MKVGSIRKLYSVVLSVWWVALASCGDPRREAIEKHLGVSYPYEITRLEPYQFSTGSIVGANGAKLNWHLMWHFECEQPELERDSLVVILSAESLGWQRPVGPQDQEWTAFVDLLRILVDEHLSETEQDSLLETVRYWDFVDPRRVQGENKEYEALRLRWALSYWADNGAQKALNAAHPALPSEAVTIVEECSQVKAYRTYPSLATNVHHIPSLRALDTYRDFPVLTPPVLLTIEQVELLRETILDRGAYCNPPYGTWDMYSLWPYIIYEFACESDTLLAHAMQGRWNFAESQSWLANPRYEKSIGLHKRGSDVLALARDIFPSDSLLIEQKLDPSSHDSRYGR